MFGTAENAAIVVLGPVNRLLPILVGHPPNMG